MFLATTPLPDFWDTDQELLLLGPWCLPVGRKEPPPGLRARLMESPWDEPGAGEDALRRYEAARENLLSFLTLRLNAAHGAAHGSRYWRLLLGPWLIAYVTAFCDRELHVRAALRRHPGLSTRRMDLSRLAPPYDVTQYARLLDTDEFNLRIYSQVVEHLGLPAEVRPAPAAVEPAVGPRWKACVHDMISKANAGLRRLRGGEACFSDIYCDRRSVFALMRSSGFALWPALERLPPGMRFEADADLRRRVLEGFPAQNEFEALLGKCLESHLPTLYLEGYPALRRHVLSRWPRLPKVLLTSVGWYFNDSFKLLAAESGEHGGKLVICQHGGAYGMFEPMETEKHERSVADRYWTWGWEDDRGGAALTPMPIPRLSRPRPRRPGGDFLLLCNSMSRYPYSYYFANMPVWHRFEEHLEERERFIARLPEKARAALSVRLPRDDYGWGGRQRLEARFPGLRFDPFAGGWSRRIETVGLAVVDQPQSTYLESLAADVPTVLFWNPGLWRMRPEALPFLQILRQAGILHDGPEQAADKVAGIFSDPAAWWATSEVQEARKAFCRRFARGSPDWASVWAREIEAAADS